MAEIYTDNQKKNHLVYRIELEINEIKLEEYHWLMRYHIQYFMNALILEFY